MLKVFASNVDRLRTVLFDTVGALQAGETRDCLCSHALDGIDTGLELP